MDANIRRLLREIAATGRMAKKQLKSIEEELARREKEGEPPPDPEADREMEELTAKGKEALQKIYKVLPALTRHAFVTRMRRIAPKPRRARARDK
jgi:Sec-independent protein translocase protein TatA